MREFVRTSVILTPARVEGGSAPRFVTPFPLHPVHPVHPAENSKFGIFDGRVVILGLGGALALCFFEFCWTASYETLTFETSFGPRPSRNRLESRCFA